MNTTGSIPNASPFHYIALIFPLYSAALRGTSKNFKIDQAIKTKNSQIGRKVL